MSEHFIQLPLKHLRAHLPDEAPEYIRMFEYHFGKPPEDRTTLLEWFEVLSAHECFLLCMCLDQAVGNKIVTTVAIQAASRVLPLYEEHFPTEGAPRRAVELAEKWLLDPEAVSAEELDSAGKASGHLAYGSPDIDLAASFAARSVSVALRAAWRVKTNATTLASSMTTVRDAPNLEAVTFSARSAGEYAATSFSFSKKRNLEREAQKEGFLLLAYLEFPVSVNFSSP